MTDILAEVDDMMRQERVVKFWKENGNIILVAVFGAIAAAALMAGWRSWNEGVNIRGTDALLALTQDAGFPANLENSEPDMRPALRGMAMVEAAGAYVKQGKNDEALVLYKKTAEDKSVPPELRHLALLMQARIAPDADQNLMQELGLLAYDRRSPWRYHALIEIAALAADKGDFKTARAHLAEVINAKALPETLYARARTLDHVYALREARASAKTGS